MVIEPVFFNCDEIRMGSPFSICTLKLEDDGMTFFPELNRHGWQNIYAQSQDARYLALVQWDIAVDNKPGFRIVVLDTQDKSIETSHRFPGCCTSVTWENNNFLWAAWPEGKGVILPWK